MIVYRNTGGNFDAPPITNAVAVGTATLSFQSCTSGRFDYEINLDGTARTGSIPLSRLGSAQYCEQGWTPTFSFSQQGISPALEGAWYDPNTSGQASSSRSCRKTAISPRSPGSLTISTASLPEAMGSAGTR